VRTRWRTITLLKKAGFFLCEARKKIKSMTTTAYTFRAVFLLFLLGRFRVMNNEKTLVILDPVLKKGFTSVPNIVLYAKNLSMPARCLYSILLSFAWSESECFPGQERLADVAGCTDRTIRKYLDELKEYGLISWVQRGLNQTNVYYINDLSKVESLKALGDKDRKGCSGQERKELSDKEYSVKRSVVVVDPPAGENSNSETASSTVTDDRAAFDLPAGSEMEVCGQEEDPEKNNQELPAREPKRKSNALPPAGCYLVSMTNWQPVRIPWAEMTEIFT